MKKTKTRGQTVGKAEGAPRNRLRQRSGKQPAKNDLERSASKELAYSKRAKRTPGIQASDVKRTKKPEETEYACSIESCIMTFDSKKEMVQHEKNISSVQGCRKKFVLHKYPFQYQRLHRDERPLECPWRGCMKTFKWVWARMEQIRVHTGERPYTCGGSDCGKTFRFLSDFSRHNKRTIGHPRKLKE